MIRTGNERTGNRLLDIPVKGGEELTEATMRRDMQRRQQPPPGS